MPCAKKRVEDKTKHFADIDASMTTALMGHGINFNSTVPSPWDNSHGSPIPMEKPVILSTTE